jgi:hypothetical protein
VSLWPHFNPDAEKTVPGLQRDAAPRRGDDLRARAAVPGRDVSAFSAFGPAAGASGRGCSPPASVASSSGGCGAPPTARLIGTRCQGRFQAPPAPAT